MHGPEKREEIDWLLEHEYALQAQLDRVHTRLELLLGTVVVEREVDTPKHLTLVVSNPPDGVA
jgi:hypothetical protein